LGGCRAAAGYLLDRCIARYSPGDGPGDTLSGAGGLPGETAGLTVKQTIQQEDLLADIDNLLQQIKIAMKNADDWEERYNEWGEYDDEDSLGPYEEFIEPLTDLFDRIKAAFDYGNLALARAAYQKIIQCYPGSRREHCLRTWPNSGQIVCTQVLVFGEGMGTGTIRCASDWSAACTELRPGLKGAPAL
jgi:tetratricopeptide (TPR) repeat protein